MYSLSDAIYDNAFAKGFEIGFVKGQVFFLSNKLGYSVEEISKELGISEEQVTDILAELSEDN